MISVARGERYEWIRVLPHPHPPPPIFVLSRSRIRRWPTAWACAHAYERAPGNKFISLTLPLIETREASSLVHTRSDADQGDGGGASLSLSPLSHAIHPSHSLFGPAEKVGEEA